MILKDYQLSAIQDLEDFLQLLDRGNSLPEAYKIFWENRDVPAKPPYQNTIPKVPQVCFKVPTGGGKTFIAAASIKIICDYVKPDKNRVVVWLVPSETILTQTYKNLSNGSHPYKKKLYEDFGYNIEVYTKEQLLSGENFSPTEVSEQLSIFILSYDSFRKKSKEFYKVFQENGQLDKFVAEFKNSEEILPDAELNSLIQVIRHYNPIVIIDESHHATTKLSIEMLENFNPSFILELTATPKENSNVITYVPAWKLKSAGMVKLPVIVYNRHTQKEVIADAINFRDRLEKISVNEKIRPIVLFQAESKGKGDRTTFEKIKEELIKIYDIPDEQIAIKTAEINDLKNVDLMAFDCPIRYIITINALKEGWDCPFAYILASLANKTSTIDVEQILGRILRRPFTKNFSERRLNMCYVFTASIDFRQTLEKIVIALNSAGFSEQEYRAANEVEESFEPLQTFVKPLQLEGLNTASGNFIDKEKNNSNINSTVNEFDENNSSSNDSIEEEFKKADELGKDYERNFKNVSINNRSVDEQEKMKYFPMQEQFKVAREIKLPQFFCKGARNLFESTEDVIISKEMLCKNFSLRDKDTEIDFDNLNYEIVSFDLYEQENFPRYRFLSDDDTKSFLEYFDTLPSKSQIRQCVGAIATKIDKRKNVPSSQEIFAYVNRIISAFDKDRLQDAIQHIGAYTQRIDNKIDDLLSEYAKKNFMAQIELKKIFGKPSYMLPEKIAPTNFTKNIFKSLYTAELNDMNDLEHKIITKISSMENVLWWHRNRARKEFCINGFINHYPDFLVMMKSGVLVVIEVKGDDRDNSDSRRKLQLGKLWASISGFNKYSYFMVFDSKPVEGALSLNEFLATIKAL